MEEIRIYCDITASAGTIRHDVNYNLVDAVSTMSMILYDRCIVLVVCCCISRLSVQIPPLRMAPYIDIITTSGERGLGLVYRVVFVDLSRFSGYTDLTLPLPPLLVRLLHM